MRYVVSVLVVGSLLLGPSLAHAQIETEVSEVTGVKRVESADMRSLHGDTYAGSHAAFRAEYVDDPDEGTSWILSVYGFTDEETQVSRTNRFVVQADGRQFEPTRLESKTREVDGSLIEIKRATFPRSAFEVIAHAQMVTLSIGGAQFSAIEPRRKDLRRILERVPDTNAPQTARNDSSDSR